MFIQLNEATNHTVHVSNHGALSTFIALSEALKGGFIMTYIYIYIYIYLLHNTTPDVGEMISSSLAQERANNRYCFLNILSSLIKVNVGFKCLENFNKYNYNIISVLDINNK